MGYFLGKPKGTAQSISGMLTNRVKENIVGERDKYKHFLENVLPLEQGDDGHQFSGDGVSTIREKVSDAYKHFNTYSRFKVQESACDRKSLFLAGGE